MLTCSQVESCFPLQAGKFSILLDAVFRIGHKQTGFLLLDLQTYDFYQTIIKTSGTLLANCGINELVVLYDIAGNDDVRTEHLSIRHIPNHDAGRMQELPRLLMSDWT